MSTFLFLAMAIVLFSLAILFFSFKNNISVLSKSIVVLLASVSIALLFIRIVNFSALTASPQFSPEAKSEYIDARNNPNSIIAWNDLGRKYLLEKEYVNAYMAYSESQQLDSFVGLGLDKQQAFNERLKWMSGLAEARILAQGGNIDTKSAELIESGLELDPQHPKALWYGGLSAAQQGDFLIAQSRWNSLLQQNPPEAFRNVVQSRLNSLDQLLIERSEKSEEAWVLRFKLRIAEELLSAKKPQSRVFASIRQGQQRAPLIARSYSLAELESAQVLNISAQDRIAGMSGRNQLNWDEPSSLSLIWSPSGDAVSAENVRLEQEISRASLDSVFEYTLK